MALSDLYTLILMISALMVIVSLGFPYYLHRFRKVRADAKQRGLDYRPSKVVMFLYIWVVVGAVLSFYFVAAFTLPASQQYDVKAIQSEAKSNLASIFTHQVAYFGEHGTYAGGTDAFDDLTDWMPEGKTRYAYYLGDDVIAPTKAKHEILYKPGENWPFSIMPEVTDTTFRAMAIGNIDEDKCPDVWVINEKKVLINILNDTNNKAMDDVYADGSGAEEVGRLDKVKAFFHFELLSRILIVVFLVITLFIPIVLPALIVLLFLDRRRYKAALRNL